MHEICALGCSQCEIQFLSISLLPLDFRQNNPKETTKFIDRQNIISNIRYIWWNCVPMFGYRENPLLNINRIKYKIKWLDAVSLFGLINILPLIMRFCWIETPVLRAHTYIGTKKHEQIHIPITHTSNPFQINRNTNSLKIA